jgi:Tfp pilus assembly protein PilF
MHKNRLVWLSIAFLLLSLTACAESKVVRKEKAKAARKVGEAFLRQENYTAALREFLEAERLYPNDHILHYDLGIAYSRKGKKDLAIRHFKKAINLKPGFAAAVNNLGTVYFDKGDYDAAIANFKIVLEDLLYATPHFAYYNLGRAYFMKKEYALAEEYFLKALEIEPRFVEPLVELGRLYIVLDRKPEALAALKSAVEQSPEMARAYYFLAEVQRMSGNTVKALQAYEKVVELVPNSSLAREAQKRKKTLR